MISRLQRSLSFSLGAAIPRNYLKTTPTFPLHLPLCRHTDYHTSCFHSLGHSNQNNQNTATTRNHKFPRHKPPRNQKNFTQQQHQHPSTARTLHTHPHQHHHQHLRRHHSRHCHHHCHCCYRVATPVRHWRC